MLTPRERFMNGYNGFPFGSPETMVPDTPEYRGWSTRCRESMRKSAGISGGNGQRPIYKRYAPKLQGSEAAVNTVIKFL